MKNTFLRSCFFFDLYCIIFFRTKMVSLLHPFENKWKFLFLELWFLCENSILSNIRIWFLIWFFFEHPKIDGPRNWCITKNYFNNKKVIVFDWPDFFLNQMLTCVWNMFYLMKFDDFFYNSSITINDAILMMLFSSNIQINDEF